MYNPLSFQVYTFRFHSPTAVAFALLLSVARCLPTKQLELCGQHQVLTLQDDASQLGHKTGCSGGKTKFYKSKMSESSPLGAQETLQRHRLPKMFVLSKCLSVHKMHPCGKSLMEQLLNFHLWSKIKQSRILDSTKTASQQSFKSKSHCIHSPFDFSCMKAGSQNNTTSGLWHHQRKCVTKEDATVLKADK